MTRIDVGSADTGDDIKWLVVWHPDHEIHRSYRVTHSVKRLDEFLVPLSQEFGILFLDVG